MRFSFNSLRPLFAEHADARVEHLEGRRLFAADCAAFGQAVAACAQSEDPEVVVPPPACAAETEATPGGGSDFGQAVADAADACRQDAPPA